MDEIRLAGSFSYDIQQIHFSGNIRSLIIICLCKSKSIKYFFMRTFIINLAAHHFLFWHFFLIFWLLNLNWFVRALKMSCDEWKQPITNMLKFKQIKFRSQCIWGQQYSPGVDFVFKYNVFKGYFDGMSSSYIFPRKLNMHSYSCSQRLNSSAFVISRNEQLSEWQFHIWKWKNCWK